MCIPNKFFMCILSWPWEYRAYYNQNCPVLLHQLVQFIGHLTGIANKPQGIYLLQFSFLYLSSSPCNVLNISWRQWVSSLNRGLVVHVTSQYITHETHETPYSRNGVTRRLTYCPRGEKTDGSSDWVLNFCAAWNVSLSGPKQPKETSVVSELTLEEDIQSPLLHKAYYI